MIFSIVVDPVAERAILDQINYIGVEQQSPINALRVLDAIENAKQSLSTFPERCTLADENEFSRHEIRALPVKSCLILFAVDKSARRVSILGFRHERQLPIRNL